MGFLQTKNNAKSTSTGLDNTDDPVTFSVGSGDGAKFPDTADGSFRVTVWSTAYADPGDDTNMEILEVTSRSTDSLTATRAQESTAKVAHSGTVNVALLSTSGLREETISALKTGWNPAKTWTRTGNHTFTITGDVTAQYPKGTKIRYKQGGAYEYGVVISATYSDPNTTVTLATNTDYAMAVGAITDNCYSYAATPQGFPNLFNYTPVFDGFSSDPTGVTATFAITGRLCSVNMQMTGDGTSNSANFNISLPVATTYAVATAISSTWSYAKDNGSVLTAGGPIAKTGSNFRLDKAFGATSGWTASGAKRANFQAFYFI